MCIVIISPNCLVAQLHMTDSPNLCGREEQWRLQLLCIHWQPDRWNNLHTWLHYQPAPRITWQQTGRLWGVAQCMRNSAVAAPNGPRLDSSSPTFPHVPSSAVLQLTNFTTVLHWLHTWNCILRWLKALIWLKSNGEKGHWCKGGGGRQSAQQHELGRNMFWSETLSLCLKSPDRRLPSCSCKKLSPTPAYEGGADFPINLLTFKVER